MRGYTKAENDENIIRHPSNGVKVDKSVSKVVYDCGEYVSVVTRSNACYNSSHGKNFVSAEVSNFSVPLLGELELV